MKESDRGSYRSSNEQYDSVRASATSRDKSRWKSRPAFQQQQQENRRSGQRQQQRRTRVSVEFADESDFDDDEYTVLSDSEDEREADWQRGNNADSDSDTGGSSSSKRKVIQKGYAQDRSSLRSAAATDAVDYSNDADPHGPYDRDHGGYESDAVTIAPRSGRQTRRQKRKEQLSQMKVNFKPGALSSRKRAYDAMDDNDIDDYDDDFNDDTEYDSISERDSDDSEDSDADTGATAGGSGSSKSKNSSSSRDRSSSTSDTQARRDAAAAARFDQTLQTPSALDASTTPIAAEAVVPQQQQYQQQQQQYSDTRPPQQQRQQQQRKAGYHQQERIPREALFPKPGKRAGIEYAQRAEGRGKGWVRHEAVEHIRALGRRGDVTEMLEVRLTAYLLVYILFVLR
jgi:hypothetical protein